MMTSNGFVPYTCSFEQAGLCGAPNGFECSEKVGSVCWYAKQRDKNFRLENLRKKRDELDVQIKEMEHGG